MAGYSLDMSSSYSTRPSCAMLTVHDQTRSCFGTERMIAMRDFLWQYFSMTGEIDAYLLYKQHETVAGNAGSYDQNDGDAHVAFTEGVVREQ